MGFHPFAEIDLRYTNIFGQAGGAGGRGGRAGGRAGPGGRVGRGQTSDYEHMETL